MATKVVMNTLRDSMGGSLPVQNVQELASRNHKHIPTRYIRPEIQPDDVSMEVSSQIPVIDMAKLLASDDSDSDCLSEMAKLHQACKEWGFFQLMNHGATTAIEKMKEDMEDFFKLPLDKKTAYAQTKNNTEGYGQTFVVSDDQKLEWGDMLLLRPLPISQRNVELWPKQPTSFRSSLEAYSSELQRVWNVLIKLVALNLRVDPEGFMNMFKDGRQAIRMNYYPPCLQADKVYGIAPHSDTSGLTLLVQVNEVEGLQIKKNGKWVPIKPTPGSIVVNIGDALEIISNGEYSSIEHRVMVNVEKERMSIAAFQAPNPDTLLAPLPDILKEQEAKYKAILFKDYLKLYFSAKLNGKVMLDHVRLPN